MSWYDSCSEMVLGLPGVKGQEPKLVTQWIQGKKNIWCKEQKKINFKILLIAWDQILKGIMKMKQE